MYQEYWNRWNQKGKLFFFEGEGGGGGGSASSAVDDAAKKLAEKKEEAPTSDKDDKDNKTEPTAEELAEIDQARNLLRILKDPTQRRSLVETLAANEGITKDSTKEEKKEAVRNIASIIKDGLGEDYEVLGSRLTKVITEVLDLHNKENVAPIKEDLAKKELVAQNAKVTEAYDSVFAEFSNSDKLVEKVAELSKEIKPGEKTTPQQYFKRLLNLAAEEKGIKLIKVSAKDTVLDNFKRRENNRNDASSRLASEHADDSNVTRNTEGKKMTLDDAIAEGARKAEALLKK